MNLRFLICLLDKYSNQTVSHYCLKTQITFLLDQQSGGHKDLVEDRRVTCVNGLMDSYIDYRQHTYHDTTIN